MSDELGRQIVVEHLTETASEAVSDVPQQEAPADVLPSEPPATPIPVNPYNPTHTMGCRCPSCCKKAKLARGEPLNQRKSPKSSAKQPNKVGSRVAASPAPHPPVDTVARAQAAAHARWEQIAAARYDWENTPLEEACQHLAALRKEIEEGGRVLQQRTSTATFKDVPCHVCHKAIPNGKWAQSRTIRNAATGLLAQIFLCSQLCISKYQQNPGNYPPDNGPTGLPNPGLPEFAKTGKAKVS